MKSNDNLLKINLKQSTEKNIKVYYFDYKKYEEALNNIKFEQLDFEIDKNVLKGKIKSNGGTLMIKLPYEKGFEIYVNGKLKEYKKVLNTFIGVELEQGESDILVRYKQPGLEIGIITSISSIIACTIYVTSCRKKNKYEEKI